MRLQSLSYVFPSQPQTGASVGSQVSGLTTHVPSASAALHMPARRLQNWPGSHRSPAIVPHVFPARPEPVHSPSCVTETCARRAAQAFPYVLPSSPHTGRQSSVHMAAWQPPFVQICPTGHSPSTLQDAWALQPVAPSPTRRNATRIPSRRSPTGMLVDRDRFLGLGPRQRGMAPWGSIADRYALGPRAACARRVERSGKRNDPGTSMFALGAPSGPRGICAARDPGCSATWVSELGASRLALGATDMPSRSTSSPPSHPVTVARSTPVTERVSARSPGAVGTLHL